MYTTYISYDLEKAVTVLEYLKEYIGVQHSDSALR